MMQNADRNRRPVPARTVDQDSAIPRYFLNAFPEMIKRNISALRNVSRPPTPEDSVYPTPRVA